MLLYALFCPFTSVMHFAFTCVVLFLFFKFITILELGEGGYLDCKFTISVEKSSITVLVDLMVLL